MRSRSKQSGDVALGRRDREISWIGSFAFSVASLYFVYGGIVVVGAEESHSDSAEVER
jgi:hypothetical protein